jgi:hypothetical protein
MSKQVTHRLGCLKALAKKVASREPLVSDI